MSSYQCCSPQGKSLSSRILEDQNSLNTTYTASYAVVAEAGVNDLQCFFSRHRNQSKPSNVEQTGMNLVQRLRLITGVINCKSYVVVLTSSSSSSPPPSVGSSTGCQAVMPRSSALPAHSNRHVAILCRLGGGRQNC